MYVYVYVYKTRPLRVQNQSAPLQKKKKKKNHAIRGLKSEGHYTLQHVYYCFFKIIDICVSRTIPSGSSIQVTMRDGRKILALFDVDGTLTMPRKVSAENYSFTFAFSN